MKPQLKTLAETRIVGLSATMSFAENKSQKLWRSFMPRHHEVPNRLGNELYSVEVYPGPDFFRQFDPGRRFEKWAGVRVSNSEDIPSGMKTLMLPGGRYAVFNYQGKGSEAAATYQHIYGQWLPNSDFHLDHRPHFAVMGEKYKNEDPLSEEELWIPVRAK